MTKHADARGSYAFACDTLHAALNGGARRAIVDTALEAGDFVGALARLRSRMRSHRFAVGTETLNLQPIVARLDARCKKEGIHALEGWDYTAHRFPAETVPVLMLDYCAHIDRAAESEREALALLLDHYFLSVLGLLAVRAWDEGDPNENLSCVSALLNALNGPHGSGHRIADDAETLLLLAIAYYNPDEQAYDHLVRRAWALDAPHRLSLALVCAAALGSHLRWGLRFMYRNDVGRMREDNIVDYPWLLFSVATLMDAYIDGHDAGERERIGEALLNAISADPWAFIAAAPPALREYERENAGVRSQIAEHRRALLGDFERHMPTSGAYSPVSFGCNFLSNAVVAAMATALEDGVRRPSLNTLFRGSTPGGEAERFAKALMGYSSARPERLGAGGAPLIVYDPYDGVHAYNTAVRVLTPR